MIEASATTSSENVRACLADVVAEYGGDDEARAIRDGAEIVLADIAEALGLTFAELAGAWAGEVHRVHGLYIGLGADDKIITVRRRSELS